MDKQKEICLKESMDQGELFYYDLIELFRLHPLNEIERTIHQFKR
jgi:hypothetical protein